MKIAILLNLIDDEGIDIFNILRLDVQQRTVYKTVLTEIETFQKENIVYERFVFHNQKQEEGRSFDHFII